MFVYVKFNISAASDVDSETSFVEFCMGCVKRSVTWNGRFVAILNLFFELEFPSSMEKYQQEAARCGHN